MLLDTVVIGCSLESALFAYCNQYHYIPSSRDFPFFFEHSDLFSLFGTSNRREIFETIKVIMGLLSLNLEYENLKHIRVSDEQIKIFDDNLIVEFEYGTCFICDQVNVIHNSPILKAEEATFKVVDDFKVSRMGKDAIGLDSKFSSDGLVSEVHFYNSKRVDGSKYVTDIVTVSNLSREELYEFNYSDTMATFKLRDMLKAMGYLGLKENARYKNGEFKYKKIQLEHLQRFVYPIDNNSYKDSKKVKFLSLGLEDFLDGKFTRK